MKIEYISLFISFVIHAVILIVLYIIDTDRIQMYHQLEIHIQPIISMPQTESNSIDEIHTDMFPDQSIGPHDNTKANLYSFNYHLLDSLYQPASPFSEPPAILNPKEWQQFLFEALKKEYFLSEINLPAKKDSQLTITSLQELDLLQSEYDPVDGFGREHLDNVHPFPSIDKIVSLIREQLNKNNPPQFDFIPSEIQLNIIKLLCNRENATQLELYSMISPNQPITIEMLNQDLDLLTDKAFLTREKVSPEQIFNLFGIPIEMSRKNQLNPVYRYDLNINKQKLIAYLQSKYFLLEQELQTDPSDSSTIITNMKTLQEKIFILIN